MYPLVPTDPSCRILRTLDLRVALSSHRHATYFSKALDLAFLETQKSSACIYMTDCLYSQKT